MPTRVMSYHGYFAATALCQRMRSGKPASPRFFQATSWNAFERLDVPMPSICTTMKPSSAWACIAGRPGLKVFGTNEPCGPA
jgi:hypothetical protein